MDRVERMASHLRKFFLQIHDREYEVMQRLARSLPPTPTVVNIGAGRGTSGLAFLTARPDLVLYTVDIEPEMGLLGGLGSERLVFIEELKMPVRPRWHQIEGDSADVGNAWREIGRKADLVFVDGDHSYDGCSRDLRAWWPVLNTGGYLLVHDINMDGVARAVADAPFLHDRRTETVEKTAVYRKRSAD